MPTSAPTRQGPEPKPGALSILRHDAVNSPHLDIA
jgi:hypothetical protein